MLQSCLVTSPHVRTFHRKIKNTPLSRIHMVDLRSLRATFHAWNSFSCAMIAKPFHSRALCVQMNNSHDGMTNCDATEKSSSFFHKFVQEWNIFAKLRNVWLLRRKVSFHFSKHKFRSLKFALRWSITLISRYVAVGIKVKVRVLLTERTRAKLNNWSQSDEIAFFLLPCPIAFSLLKRSTFDNFWNCWK